MTTTRPDTANLFLTSRWQKSPNSVLCFVSMKVLHPPKSGPSLLVGPSNLQKGSIYPETRILGSAAEYERSANRFPSSVNTAPMTNIPITVG